MNTEHYGQKKKRLCLLFVTITVHVTALARVSSRHDRNGSAIVSHHHRRLGLFSPLRLKKKGIKQLKLVKIQNTLCQHFFPCCCSRVSYFSPIQNPDLVDPVLSFFSLNLFPAFSNSCM